MSLLRKIRGAIGNGLAWAGAWILGKLALLVVPVLTWGSVLPGRLVLIILASAGITGFINGTLFSGVFALVNRSRSLNEIRSFHTGLLGLAVGATLPIVQVAVAASLGFAMPTSAIVFGLVVGGGLGTAIAVGTLRLAQTADRVALDQPRREPVVLGADRHPSA